jgi:lysozyme family protein
VQQNYEPFVDRLIQRYEGGYGWNKKDKGGPTKYGITCYDLAEHRGQKMDSMARWAPLVKAMTLDEAEEIYKTKYAAKIAFDALPSGIDCCMMDYAVNSGYARSVRVGGALLGITPTTTVGTDFLQAVEKVDPEKFVKAMCAERLHFMHGIRGGSDWEEFGIGWQRRVDDLETYCEALAKSQAPHIAPDMTFVPTPKAKHPEPDPNVSTNTIGAAAIAATTTAAAGVPWYAIVGALAIIVAVGVVSYLARKKAAATANETVALPPGVTPAQLVKETMRQEKAA